MLPNGFEALVVVDSLGSARHLAVNDNGDIYVKLRASYPDGSNVAMRDEDGDGKADVIKSLACIPMKWVTEQPCAFIMATSISVLQAMCSALN